jgi:hypothetical protein
VTDTHPLDWFTIDEAARICRRTPKTIRNLLSTWQLPRSQRWIVVNRLRRRITFLSPETVRWLQRVTFDGEDPQKIPRPAKNTSFLTHHDQAHD